MSRLLAAAELSPDHALGPVYLAHAGFEAELADALRRAGREVLSWHGPLAITAGDAQAHRPGPSTPPPTADGRPAAAIHPDPQPDIHPDIHPNIPWALDMWTAPRLLPVASIKSAAAALRAIQRNWSLTPVEHHRRAALIADALPPISARPVVFPTPVPTAPLGGWTLLRPDLMLASPSKTSPYTGGAPVLVENRTDPPSRAYLKLWEAFLAARAWPQPGERCLDLGACPGGWTWAVAALGARVVAVDKAPLDPAVVAMPGVTVRQESAFGLDPRDHPEVDWLLSDVICYPARLLGLVQRWIEAGKARRMLCTVKFQGETDHAVAAAFAAIPGAYLTHGSYNKHELMFHWARPEG